MKIIKFIFSALGVLFAYFSFTDMVDDTLSMPLMFLFIMFVMFINAYEMNQKKRKPETIMFIVTGIFLLIVLLYNVIMQFIA